MFFQQQAFEGTIRTFEPKVREDVIARFEKVVQTTADQFGAQVDITWGNSPYVTYNDHTLTPLIFENSKAFAEVIETLPSTGGEDFAAYQRKYQESLPLLAQMVKKMHQTGTMMISFCER